MTAATAQKATSSSDLSDATSLVQALSVELNREFFEREEEITSILTALIAGEHVLLLGPPGTAKSALTNVLCRALGGNYFSYLFTKFSTPEEVFGPISLKGLEQDRYERVTKGYMPWANIFFADEIFKANSAILNALLTALNECEFDNGGQRVKIPLQLCIGASNELPQDDSLGALYDRFVLRHWVTRLTNEDNLRSLLSSSSEPQVTTTLSQQDVVNLRDARKAVKVPDSVIDTVLEVRRVLAQQHGIEVSDRRWRKCMKLIQAHAVLDGRTEADSSDVLVLAHALWDDPETRHAIYGSVTQTVDPNAGKANQLLDAAIEVYSHLDKTTDDVAVLAGTNKALKQILAQVEQVKESPAVLKAVSRVKAMQEEVGKIVLANL